MTTYQPSNDEYELLSRLNNGAVLRRDKKWMLRYTSGLARSVDEASAKRLIEQKCLAIDSSPGAPTFVITDLGRQVLAGRP